MESDISRISRVFPAKLLMFGEHLLLTGAPALAVPVPAFEGHWAWATSPEHQHGLEGFARCRALEAIEGLDIAAFQADLDQGLFFESNIPRGYGLGSSGALCAAVYYSYMTDKSPDLSGLKAIFARMEGYFHGNSSGIDPLTSYLNQPLLISDKTQVSLVKTPEWKHPPLVFLIDSRIPRQTGPLVQWFLEHYAKTGFANLIHRKLLRAHKAMIQAWLEADSDIFWPMLRQVSRFQLEHFIPMIPATLRDLWIKSIDHQQFTLKICGAGGGGFVLGFATDHQSIEGLLTQFRVIFPFEQTAGRTFRP